MASGNLFHFLQKFKEGKHEPEEMKRFLERFLNIVNSKEPNDSAEQALVFRYLAEGFTDYLNTPEDEKDLEKSLGLKRTRGRPNNQEKQIEIAADVLRLLVEGKTLADALFTISDKTGQHKSQIEKSWYANVLSAYLYLNNIDKSPFTDEQKIKIQEILDKRQT